VEVGIRASDSSWELYVHGRRGMEGYAPVFLKLTLHKHPRSVQLMIVRRPLMFHSYNITELQFANYSRGTGNMRPAISKLSVLALDKNQPRGYQAICHMQHPSLPNQESQRAGTVANINANVSPKLS
jgi:hypothetical protein